MMHTLEYKEHRKKVKELKKYLSLKCDKII